MEIQISFRKKIELYLKYYKIIKIHIKWGKFWIIL